MHQFQFSIVVPAYNEAGNIEALLRNLGSSFPECEVIVVDDGSSDDTFAIASRFFPQTTFRHNKNRGQGATLKTGIRNASGEFVVLVDGDGQHPAEAVRAVIERVQADPTLDVVLTRRDNVYSSGHLRSLGKVVINFVVKKLTGEDVRDANCGLRAFRRAKILPFFFQLPDAFSFSTTSTVLAYMENFSLTWIDISMRLRENGTSQLRMSHGINTIVLVFRLIVLFNPLKFFLPLTGYAFLLGVLAIMLSFFTSNSLGKNYIFFFLFGSLSFILGLLSEQLSNIRKELVFIKNDR
jgi:glycosyltransferase involved in cell wall biosynthesis